MVDPPTHLSADDAASTAFLIIAVVFLAACVLHAATRPSGRRWLPGILLAAGFVAALQESLIDRMILLWYPSDAPNVVYTAVGHHQPLYMILIYGGFVGIGTYGTYQALHRDPSGRGLWLPYVGIIAMDAFFEIFATATNVFYYYGDQPFQVVPDGWPLWVAFLAAGAPVLAGWALYHLLPRAKGAWKGVVALAVPPVAWVTVYFAAGWPTFITVNSGSSAVLRWGAAVLTMAMSAGMVRALIALQGSEPADASRRVRTSTTVPRPDLAVSRHA